jgi:hypothetical protein
MAAKQNPRHAVTQHFDPWLVLGILVGETCGGVKAKIFEPAQDRRGSNRNKAGNELVDGKDHAPERRSRSFGRVVLFWARALRTFLGECIKRCWVIDSNSVPHGLCTSYCIMNNFKNLQNKYSTNLHNSSHPTQNLHRTAKTSTQTLVPKLR